MAVNSSLDMNVSFFTWKSFPFPPFHRIKVDEFSACGRDQCFFWGGADAICNAVAISSLSGGPGPYFKCYTNRKYQQGASSKTCTVYAEYRRQKLPVDRRSTRNSEPTVVSNIVHSLDSPEDESPSRSHSAPKGHPGKGGGLEQVSL